MTITRYKNRQHAGVILAEELFSYHGKHALVLAVPRGGIPVAVPVVQALDGELDLIMGRKIGAPLQPELAIGAVSEDQEVLLNPHFIQYYNLTDDEINQMAAHEAEEIKRRLLKYRGKQPAADAAGRTVIVVDDGVATGFTITAALRSVRRRKPNELVLAVPVAPPDTVEMLSHEVDRIICPLQPETFSAVGQFYDDFGQLSDADVKQLLTHIRG